MSAKGAETGALFIRLGLNGIDWRPRLECLLEQIDNTHVLEAGSK